MFCWIFPDLSNLTRKCAKSSNLDRSRSSTYREYTISQLQIHNTISNAQNKQINILYANIKSLTMQKNNQAKDRIIVNTANVDSHGRIFSSYSYEMKKKIMIFEKYHVVSKISIFPKKEKSILLWSFQSKSLLVHFLWLILTCTIGCATE